MGGVKDVTDRITVKHFVDYGPRVQVPTVPEPNEQQTATIARFNETYAATIANGRHIIVKAGDALPMKGIDVQIVAAKGGAIARPLANGGARNPLCADYVPHPADTTENYHWLGAVISVFGRFH